jgi:multicomponent Na+:H+ antiporter subunit D
MMNNLVLALLIPFVTALLALLLRQKRTAVRSLVFFGSTLHLAYSVYLLYIVWTEGIQATALGGWPIPYAIVLTADLLSATMFLMTALMGWLGLLYTFATLDAAHERHNFYALFQFLLVGVSGAFLASDLFNLYVWFEVMLISSFGMMTLGGQRRQLEGGLKYVVINLVSSSILLMGIGLLYSATGTLNMAHLSQILAAAPPSPLLTALAMLFLVSFGIKGGIFPLFFWLPASYHTPPVAVTALFGGLLTKVGVYALFRVFTLIFEPHVPFAGPLFLVLAGLTMVVGGLGTVIQNNVRRILSFHIISQIGYMLMGLGLFSVAGIAGGIYYIVHQIIVKTALLMVGGALEQANGTGDLTKMGNQIHTRPVLAVLFGISALSMAGIPPFSGFFGKISLLLAAVEQEQYLIAGISLLVGMLTLLSMAKIWVYAFWQPAPEIDPESAPPIQPMRTTLVAVPIAALVLISILMGVGAESSLMLATATAEQLLANQGAILAVQP